MRPASGGAGKPARRYRLPPPAPAGTPAILRTARLTPLPSCRRVVPRRKLEQASKTGVGMAYACMWLPAWGDSCIDDPAGVPVGEMRLVPDPTGAPPLQAIHSPLC